MSTGIKINSNESRIETFCCIMFLSMFFGHVNRGKWSSTSEKLFPHVNIRPDFKADFSYFLMLKVAKIIVLYLANFKMFKSECINNVISRKN